MAIVVAACGCFGPDNGSTTPAPTAARQDSGSVMTYTYTDADLAEGKSDSAALIKSAIDALDRSDMAAFLDCLSESDRAAAEGYTLQSGDAAKLSAGLKSAQITQAYPDIIYYRMTIDGTAYDFSTIREGVSTWKLYGL